MVVQHNLTAMNSNRMLGITTGQQAKSSEKLSSGYRINRAADDAAGLTISEKMRKQIRGLDRASTNAQDGVSAVQTAEGALTEVHDMLQRMNELAVQSANGTNSESDREAIQDEIDQLTTEIDRVAETTKFNEIYMLKGDEGTKTINLKAHDAGLKGKLVDNGDGTATFTMDKFGVGDTVNIGGKAYKIVSGGPQTEAAEGEDYTYKAGTNATASIDLSTWAQATDKLVIDGVTIDTVADAAGVADAINADATLSASYTASADDTGKLTITAKDATMKGADLGAKIDLTNSLVNNTQPAALDGTTDAVAAEFESNVKLYAENGTKELSKEEAIAELANNKKLYTTAGAETKQKEATYDYTEATNATASIDLSTWAQATDKLVIDGVTIDTVADAAGVADAINADATLSASYTASADDTGKLTITAKDATMKGADLGAKIDLANSLVNNTQPAALDGTTDAKEASYKSDTKLYAAGGTTALTDAEIKEALKNGEKLYSEAAKKADNEITADEAYKLAQKELLQANQIGDTLGTAKVVGAAAVGEAGEAGGAAEKTYTVGEKVTIGGTEYTIGDTADNAKTAITDAVAAAVAADTTTPANTNGAAATLIGSVSDGTTTIYVLKAYDGSTVYNSTNSATNPAANTPPTGDKAATDIDALIAAGATVSFTADQANGLDDSNDVSVAVADDTTDGSTVVSAAKAAELEKAAAAAGEGDEADDGAPLNGTFTITTGSAEVAKTLSFNLHVGADADMTNKIQVDIDTMNSTFLGIKGIDVVGKGNDGGMAATYAIDAIADAIAKVSSQRSALGAIQNRLEHTIANVDNVVENTTAAESRIRDTDMAEEMVEYSKNNILAQAGQSMLAQANQSNQGVLSLLG